MPVTVDYDMTLSPFGADSLRAGPIAREPAD